MTSRDGESEQTRFRSDRFFCEGGQWFFTTREGKMFGPLHNREEAEKELVMYLRDLRHRRNFGLTDG